MEYQEDIVLERINYLEKKRNRKLKVEYFESINEGNHQNNWWFEKP